MEHVIVLEFLLYQWIYMESSFIFFVICNKRYSHCNCINYVNSSLISEAFQYYNPHINNKIIHVQCLCFAPQIYYRLSYKECPF
jgi:hypothetical protein